MDRKVFYNGTILTMQAEGHTVEAVYTIGDRIAAIGNRDDVFRQITDDTERVDLEGKTLIPGFIESHAHVTDWAECEFLQFTCYHIKNIAELQDMIRENAKTKKAGEWVIGYGYNDSMVAEMRHLERADIDAASPMSTRRRWKSATSMRIRRSPQAGRAKSTSARTASRAACSSDRRTISP